MRARKEQYISTQPDCLRDTRINAMEFTVVILLVGSLSDTVNGMGKSHKV
jgi:hypothetical protein